MNLNGLKLDEWFMGIQSFNDFPNGINYPAKYTTISDKLNRWVHPFVNTGAMINKSGYLTDHGPAHIAMVITRVTQLIADTAIILNPYEAFILLMAIHIHDVGNILGRKKHEINANIIIKKLGSDIAGEDRIEWDYIYDIASAHGGEDKDKISKLPEGPEPIDEKTIRPQLLAALLKFADELAENSSRADRFNLTMKNIPKKSKLYHEYALCLNSVIPNPKNREISLYFIIDYNKLCRKFLKLSNDGKKYEEVFLIDEIYLRTLKTHYERLYCMRFLRNSGLDIDKIRVNITIRLRNGEKVTKGYDLIETGLSNLEIEDMLKICPELNDWRGQKYCEKISTKTLS